MTETISATRNEPRMEMPGDTAPPSSRVTPPQPRSETGPVDTGASQTRLTEYAAAEERRAPTPGTDVTPERREEIDAYVEDNATSSDSVLWVGSDDAGGERVGDALKGNSDLGTLTAPEQRYLADGAVAEWQETRNYESVREAREFAEGDSGASRALAEAMARRTAEADTAEPLPETVDWVEQSQRTADARFNDYMRRNAVEADSVAAADAYAGAEDVFARELMDLPRSAQAEVAQAIADRRINGEAADRLVSSMFVYAKPGDLNSAENQRAMADALAMTAVPGTDATAQAERQIVADRLAGVLGTSGGRELLFNDRISPDARAWALENVLGDASWNADALGDAWESDVVTTSFGEATMERYAARGTEGQELTGDALRNTVGQALGQQPDTLPEGETDAAREARLAAGMDHAYYSDDTHAAAVADMIEQTGGPGAKVSVVPVAVTSNDFGVAAMTVFRVERADGSVAFVDDKGQRYRDLDHWQDKNELPPGRMTHPAGLELGNELTRPENTRAVIDTFGEHAGRVLDWTATGVGIAAGVAIIVGTGGTAAIVAAGAAGVYTAGRAGAEIYDESQRGVDVFDMSNPENRARWLEVAAGTLSVGAIGSGLKVANATRNGVQVSTALSRTAAGLAVAGDTADAIAMGDQALQMAKNWDQMSAGDRAGGLLNIAFWGGMGVASSRAGGAALQDAFSFTRLDNTFRTGTPYPMTEGPGMQPGEIRVAYNENGGRAGDITIETGPGPVDRAALERHTATARQMEAAGGMRDRLRVMLGGESAPVGTAAWEARLEIDKISSEARDIAGELATPNLSPARITELETRQFELSEAINSQTARIDALSQQGEGWVADPSRGQSQADALGWPTTQEAGLPEGYGWVAGQDGTPHLRRNGDLAQLEFDPASRTFVERVETSTGQSSRLPRTGGTWDGTPGNANWYSDKPEVQAITGGDPVQFTDGRPDFSPWSEGTVTLPAGMMDGTDADFAKIHRQLAEDMGLPNQTAAEQWLRANGLTPHHVSGTEIQLIPTDLHGNIPHIGSASDMRQMQDGG